MDILFSPWRYCYIAEAREPNVCVFCRIVESTDDRANFVLYRGRHCIVMLNLFPYNNGHMMIVPVQHVASLAACDEPTRQEMIELTARAESALNDEYHPDGINLGMNLGHAAGAGIAGHIHMHILPRWKADANFMTSIGETRVLPEDLPTTYGRLRPRFLEQRASARP